MEYGVVTVALWYKYDFQQSQQQEICVVLRDALACWQSAADHILCALALAVTVCIHSVCGQAAAFGPAWARCSSY